jgi:hypothetical protein
MKRLNTPGFSAEAALRRPAFRAFSRAGGLGLIECAGGTCVCQGDDDCIFMLVWICGSNWKCSDNHPICICDVAYG